MTAVTQSFITHLLFLKNLDKTNIINISNFILTNLLNNYYVFQLRKPHIDYILF